MEKNTYLKKRGFDEKTIKSFKLVEKPEKELVYINYCDIDGKHLYYRINYYGEQYKGQKPKYSSPRKKYMPGEHSWLYGLWRLKNLKDLKSLFIIEGEYNAISCWIMGYPALGIAGQQIPLKKCHLKYIPDSIKRIFVLFDDEEFTEKRAKEINNFFMDEKEILIAKYSDKKDANDYLMENRKDDFNRIIDSAESLSINSIIKKETDTRKVTKLLNKDITLDVIHSEGKKESCFVIYNNESNELLTRRSYRIDGVEYIPFHSKNIDEEKTVKIAKELIDYNTTESLTADIESFLEKYVDIPNRIDTKIATKYIFLSYVYERFSSIPYLRAIGEYGCGKSRLLDTLNICYKAIPTSASTTIAPIFRIMDIYGGTIIIDEAELSGRGERFEDLKDLLRYGKDRDRLLLRCIGKDHDVKSFNVFGPKILGSRRPYNDDALESRIIDIRMKETKSRKISLQLDENFEKESFELRGKLLLWRLDNFHLINTKAYEEYIDFNISRRLNEIYAPLVCIGYDDKEFIDGLLDKARETNVRLEEDKAMSLEANLVKVINNLHKDSNDTPMIADIIEILGAYDKTDYHPRFIANIIRSQLGLTTKRSNKGTYAIYDREIIKSLMDEYNIIFEEVKKIPITINDDVLI